MEQKPEETNDANTIAENRNSQSGMLINNVFKSWKEISRINYKSSMFLDAIKKSASVLGSLSGTFPSQMNYIQQHNISKPNVKCTNEEHDIVERFPIHVTNLMNEDQLWGCFYIFPELYLDEYSPVERIRTMADVPELIGGVLTRDVVCACLTYLKRSPILGDFVYIKLDLSSKLLVNIQVLEHYKYLVYLDLSYNYLTNLDVLSHLLYLQYLSVDHNRLTTVLEYETPQWFLTEVHYKFNSVKKIGNLKAFWSIAVLDLSHNNITSIKGLEELHFLRRLDLSFNHIQNLENLNHLPLTWLDLSYNNISMFEFTNDTGLWSLLHLEYLNLNENKLTSFKIFAGCTRLQELNARNNRLCTLLELAVYARQLRRLTILDLRANPVCSLPGYQDVILNTFPKLLVLDAQELDPVEHRNSKMAWEPDVRTAATHRLQRLLYVEQLSRTQISSFVPPADTTEVPIVVLVGREAVGKGALSRRLATECSSNVEFGRTHTTASRLNPDSYIKVSRDKFDDMLIKGEFLTYSERGGESYGLSREEAFIEDGKVKIVTMDLIGALMLQLRGRRPYLILVTCSNKKAVLEKQYERAIRQNSIEILRSYDLRERSTLQILLSGRIIITGIINEILLNLPDEKEKSEFFVPSGCSLLYEGGPQPGQGNDRDKRNIVMDLSTSSSSIEENKYRQRSGKEEASLFSLYKESTANGIDYSEADQQTSYQDASILKKYKSGQHGMNKQDKLSKSVDFSRYTSSTWKGVAGASMVPGSMKSSKSVTFTSQEMEATESAPKFDPTGMLIEPKPSKEGQPPYSISTKFPWPYKTTGGPSHIPSTEDPDLWLGFLVEAGLLQASDAILYSASGFCHKQTPMPTSLNSIIEVETNSRFQEPNESSRTSERDDYDEIHRKSPGLFWNVVSMDDPDEAFLKMKSILRDLVENQKKLNPMFDIDFPNLPHYPTVQKRLLSIKQQIAPHQLFH